MQATDLAQLRANSAGSTQPLLKVEDLHVHPPRHLEKAGKQQPASLHFVRLDAVLLGELPEPLGPVCEHGGGIRPRVDSLAQREVVEPAEQLKRPVPARVVEDLANRGLSGKAPAHARVQRRAVPFALLRLVEEGLLELVAQVTSAALACSAILLNAAGSLTARSASTLRSSSIPAFRQPATNWL